MRIIFLGTPEFAVPALEACVRESDLEVVGVVCQPDRPVGRRAELRPPAIKLAAECLGLELLQPEKIKAAASQAWLAERRPEALAVVAYGQILPPGVFELAPWGAINAHASLLPRYRGAAPIQWAIARGETETGVTTMRIEAGLDTGPMLLQEKLAIGEHETARELSPRLAQLAAQLLPPTLRGLAAGAIAPRPQDAAQATLAPLLRRQDGRMDWQWSAAQIYNRWRGFQPWPGVYASAQGQALAIHQCALPGSDFSAPRKLQQGELAEWQGRVYAGCGAGGESGCGSGGVLEIIEVQLAGRRRMGAAEFLRGQPLGLRLE